MNQNIDFKDFDLNSPIISYIKHLEAKAIAYDNLRKRSPIRIARNIRNFIRSFFKKTNTNINDKQ